MTCLELEILLADYIDGALAADQKATVESHLAECAECAELARDASGAVSFIERAALVEPPPALVGKILSELNAGPSRAVVRPSLIERLFGQRAGSILQPRFAMGVAMTILSVAMIGRLAGTANPVRMLTVAGNRVVRTWDRAVKGYENLAVVGDLQNQLDDWRQGQPDGLENRTDR
jgi:anti-sigma factor RsiW